MSEKLSGVIIVGVIVAYLIAPQVVAGAIWDTANAFVNYWQD
jgi:hypothetical protein